MTAFRFVHSNAPPPPPSTFSAAKYSRIVPNNACAIPTPQRMKYFQDASRLAGVRYRLTSSTVVNVAASLVSIASSIVNMKSWNRLWYRRSRAGFSLPAACSLRMYERLNSDVVKLTSAVSATRNTLNESTKNRSSQTIHGPRLITRTVSIAAATKVRPLSSAFSSAARSRCP